MKKKLRLLVTKDCPNDCALCCNKNFDLEKLPIVQHFDYDEIIITGGEPFSDGAINKTMALINYFRFIDIQSDRKIFVYTTDHTAVVNLFRMFDGMTLSLHTKNDLDNFLLINRVLNRLKRTENIKGLRLKVFKEVTLPKDIDLSLWNITENIEWIENCPLPSDEVFMRLKNI